MEWEAILALLVATISIVLIRMASTASRWWTMDTTVRKRVLMVARGSVGGLHRQLAMDKLVALLTETHKETMETARIGNASVAVA